MKVKLPFKQFKRVKQFMVDYAVNGIFEGQMEDEAHMIKVFNRHTEAVKALVPEDNLLIFDVRDGWEPLCNFLGVAVPDKPFPRLNRREGMPDLVMRLFGRG